MSFAATNQVVRPGLQNRPVVGRKPATNAAPAPKVVPAANVVRPTPQASTQAAPSRLASLVMPQATAGNQITLHVSPEDSQKALIDSIKTAQKSFYIETFIWHNDAAGQEVIQALADRKKELAAQGKPFDVKILIDWFGLRQGSGGSNDAGVVEQMRKLGFEVQEFSPGYVNKDAKALIPLTHRKLYIQDGNQFITGGRNIGNEYLKPTYNVKGAGEETSWHDMLYTVRGPETGRIIDDFFVDWKRAGGKEPAQRPQVLRSAGGDAKVQSVTTDPYTRTSSIRTAHDQLIKNAQKEIVAIYPYFSDDKLVKELIAAKKKNPNLSVKVMMPSNKEASHEGDVYQTLNRETAIQLVKAGVEVRYFDGGVVNGRSVQRFSHMKAMMIDGQILSIGGANGDARSYKNNHELNTLIESKDAVQQFQSQVVGPDWASAHPVTLKELENVPLWEKVKQKFLEAVDFML